MCMPRVGRRSGGSIVSRFASSSRNPAAGDRRRRLRRAPLGVGCLPWTSELMDFAARAARNEEIFRSVNERIEEGATKHGVQAALPFHCECGRGSCLGTIEIPPPLYERVIRERYHFVLIAGHENPAIERVVERKPAYVVVEKVGEAREQIDRDHPQREHRH